MKLDKVEKLLKSEFERAPLLTSSVLRANVELRYRKNEFDLSQDRHIFPSAGYHGRNKY